MAQRISMAGRAELLEAVSKRYGGATRGWSGRASWTSLQRLPALLQGSDDDLAWPLPTVQSGEANGDWLDDTDHAVMRLRT
jgi:hypothetical protein